MKKFILFVIVFEFAFIQVSVTQEVSLLPYKVVSFKYNQQIATKVYGAENFKLGIKQAYHDRYFTDDVNIYYVLKNYSGKNIYTNKNNFKRIKFSIVYYNKVKLLKSNINFYIPYDEMDINEGKHKLQLEVYIENDSLKDELLTKKEVVINKPKLFKFDEQKIVISNLQASTSAKYLGLKGIKIRLDKKFKFSANQIKGISRDKNLANYYLKVKIYNNEDNKNCYKLEEDRLSIVKVFAKNANINSQSVLFVPYRNLSLQKGKHNIKIEINVSDKEGFFSQESVATKDITINQPQVYFAFIDVSKFKIAYAKYDVGSFLGREFSKKGSKKGRGYPDVYWNLKIGTYIIYKTYVNKNSFTANAGSYKFKVLDNDYMSVNIYDRDVTSFDDFIGKFEIKNKTGNFEIKNKEISTSKFSDLIYNFIKNVEPIENKKKEQNKKINNLSEKIDISYKIDSITEVKKNGMTGVLINLSTKKPNSFKRKDSTKYFLTTVSIKEKSKPNLYKYLYTKKERRYDLFEKPYSDYYNLNKDNKLELFLPYNILNTDKNKRDFELQFKTYIISKKDLNENKIEELENSSTITNFHYYGKKILVGKQTENFKLKEIELVKIKFVNAHFKTASRVNYNNYRFSYSYSYLDLYTTKCKKIGGENLLLINSELVAHKSDKLNISIYYKKEKSYKNTDLISKTINLVDLKKGINKVDFKVNGQKITDISFNILIE